jgi:hypothetical protein
MSIPHLSLMDARHLQLAAQGLLTPRLQYGAIPAPCWPYGAISTAPDGCDRYCPRN